MISSSNCERRGRGETLKEQERTTTSTTCRGILRTLRPLRPSAFAVGSMERGRPGPFTDSAESGVMVPYRNPPYIPDNYYGDIVSTNRRAFLKYTAALASALGLESLAARALGAAPAPRTIRPDRSRQSPGRAPAPLDILILGGTGFTGPGQVEYAIARRHRVTLFNRNKTRPDLFKGRVTEELAGDLNGDTSSLEGKKFDVVLDNPTTFPPWLRNPPKYLAS